MAQEALFYSFSLERRMQPDHLSCSIDRSVDLSGSREELKPFYSETGRPSIAPEMMARTLIIGYCMDIWSERQLCDEVHPNLAYRWFCRLRLREQLNIELAADGLAVVFADGKTILAERHGSGAIVEPFIAKVTKIDFDAVQIKIARALAGLDNDAW